ncbi:MAG TPA: hypothetical protein VLS49_11920, partial [Usitatibacter sp.]|nr:hypothetical protein [Usitatibacter sp.]
MPRSRPVAIVWLFVGIVICLLGLTVYSARLLSAGHAFITGEGLWAKAQKDAVFYLARYAEEGSEADYGSYRTAMRVIEGDRSARLALAQPRPDIEAVRRGLVQGGLREEDVPRLLELHRLLRALSPMQYLMVVWARSDAYVDQLDELGRELHARGGAHGAAEVAATTRRIHRINQSLAPLESDFSQTLDDMQRIAQSFLATGIL